LPFLPMLALASSAVAAFTPVAPITRATSACRASDVVRMETVSDLEALAQKCNPIVGFWDPLALAQSGGEGYPFTESEAIGFLRHAEIKHGRVAMAAFVGFIVQSNGICFPWNLQGDLPHSAILAAGGPASQWDALPTSAKLQILGFIGLLEFFGEQQQPHYMRGGRPGDYPSLKAMDKIPHPVPLDLFDPFGLTSKMSAERKEKALVAEINNGRLAQIGIMGFMAASKGLQVPIMDGFGIAPYAGEVMAPFSSVDAGLPFVSEMLNYKLSFGSL